MRTARPTRSALVAQQQWKAGLPASRLQPQPQPRLRRSLPVARMARWALGAGAVLLALAHIGAL